MATPLVSAGRGGTAGSAGGVPSPVMAIVRATTTPPSWDSTVMAW